MVLRTLHHIHEWHFESLFSFALAPYNNKKRCERTLRMFYASGYSYNIVINTTIPTRMKPSLFLSLSWRFPESSFFVKSRVNKKKLYSGENIEKNMRTQHIITMMTVNYFPCSTRVKDSPRDGIEMAQYSSHFIQQYRLFAKNVWIGFCQKWKCHYNCGLNWFNVVFWLL